MSTKQKSTAPPAYEQLPNSEAASHIFLDRIQDTVNAEYDNANDDPADTKRLCNFLLYCLAVDYRAPISLTISESDREHFREMSATIWDMRTADQSIHLNPQDRSALAPYFWKYLHAPCTSLGIPVESAVQIVLRHAKFLTLTGHYKGCVHGLLQNLEPYFLVRKLLLDRSVLIPHLVPPGEMHSKLLDSFTEVAGFYFVSIKGERTWIVDESDPNVGFKEHVLTNWILTERGICYTANRNAAVRTAKGWVPTLGDVLQRLVGKVKKRQDIFPKSSKQEHYDGMRACAVPLSDSRSKKNSLWNHPPRARDLLSMDVPDLFESRPGQGLCDS